MLIHFLIIQILIQMLYMVKLKSFQRQPQLRQQMKIHIIPNLKKSKEQLPTVKLKFFQVQIQILITIQPNPSTDSNTYYGTTQINYEQPQTQNDYTTSYQTTNTIDLNNLNLNDYNFGTTNIESTNNTYTTEAIPITQNETTTTTTNTYIEPTSYRANIL